MRKWEQVCEGTGDVSGENTGVNRRAEESGKTCNRRITEELMCDKGREQIVNNGAITDVVTCAPQRMNPSDFIFHLGPPRG